MNKLLTSLSAPTATVLRKSKSLLFEASSWHPVFSSCHNLSLSLIVPATISPKYSQTFGISTARLSASSRTSLNLYFRDKICVISTDIMLSASGRPQEIHNVPSQVSAWLNVPQSVNNVKKG